MATLSLADGTVWGYGRAGRAGGRPVLIHHGLVGDGRFGPVWNDLGEAYGLDWVMIERPGYGATPAMEMTALADWAGMIAPVLDALGVTGELDTVGMSAGAPYAYACAAFMPDRVRSVSILSGVPFIHVPGVLDAYPAEGQAAYARYATASEAELRAEFRAFCQQAVVQVIEAGEVDGERMRLALESVLTQDAAGPAREARLQARDWGFGPSDVTCPVHVWHFTGDEMVPFEAARRSVEALHRAHTHYIEATAHMADEAMLEALGRVLSGG